MLTVGSLFSGIGGFDLGLERAGMRVVWQSEIDPYASAVLKKHWPEIPNHGDIRSIRAGTERVDLICGGFPCQPFSHAGKRAGAEDDRHLWPEMCRVIGELGPTWVLGENVAGIISMELDTVLSDLESLGYATRPFVIPAVAVDAPHRRDRVWIVANASGGRRGGTSGGQMEQSWRAEVERASALRDPDRDRDRESACAVDAEMEVVRNAVADADGERRAESRMLGEWCRSETSGARQAIGTVASGFGNIWSTEPDVGRVAHGIPNRMDRLRCLGNAIVPQVAEIIGRAIVSEGR